MQDELPQITLTEDDVKTLTQTPENEGVETNPAVERVNSKKAYSLEGLRRILKLKEVYVQELIKGILNERAAVAIRKKIEIFGDDSKDLETSKGGKYGYDEKKGKRKETSPQGKLERALTVTALRLNGIKDPNKIIEVYIENRATNGLSVYKKIREDARNLGRIENVNLAIDRLRETGFLELITISNLDKSIDAINRLAQIPDDKFRSFVEDINKYSGFVHKTFDRFGWHTKPNNIDPAFEDLDILVAQAEKGHLDEQTKESLELSERLYFLTSKSYGLEDLTDIQNKRDSIIITEALFSSFTKERNIRGPALSRFLKYLKNTNGLHRLAETFSTGIATNENFIDSINMLFWTDKKVDENDSFFQHFKQEEIAMVSYSNALKEPNADFYYTLLVNKQKDSNENLGFTQSEIAHASNEEEVYRRAYEMLYKATNEVIFGHLTSFLKEDGDHGNSILRTPFSFGDLDEFFIATLSEIDSIQFKNNLDLFALSGKSQCRKEFKNIDSYLYGYVNKSERVYINFLLNCGEDEKKLIVNNKDISDDVLKLTNSETISNAFLMTVSLLIFRGNPNSISNLCSYLENISSEIDKMSPEIRNFWNHILNLSQLTSENLVEEGSYFDSWMFERTKQWLIKKTIFLFDPVTNSQMFKDGYMSEDLLNKYGEILVLSEPPVNNMEYIVRILVKLIDEKTIENMSEANRPFWLFLKDYPELGIALLKNKQDIVISEDSFLSKESINMIILDILKDPETYNTSRVKSSIVKYLEDTENLPKSLRSIPEDMKMLVYANYLFTEDGYYIDNSGNPTVNLVEALISRTNADNYEEYRIYLLDLKDKVVRKFPNDKKKFLRTWKNLDPTLARLFFFEPETIGKHIGKDGRPKGSILNYLRSEGYLSSASLWTPIKDDLIREFSTQGIIDPEKIDLSDLSEVDSRFWSLFIKFSKYGDFLITNYDQVLNYIKENAGDIKLDRTFVVLNKAGISVEKIMYSSETNEPFSYSDFMVLNELTNSITGNFLKEGKSKALKALKGMSRNLSHLVLSLFDISHASDDTDYSSRKVRESTEEDEKRRKDRRLIDELEKDLKEIGLSGETLKSTLEVYRNLRSYIERGEFEEIIKLVPNDKKFEILSSIKKAFYSFNDLGDTAEEFEVFSEKYQRTRKIPSFVSIWKEKVLENLSYTVLENARSQNKRISNSDLVIETINLYNDGIDYYNRIQTSVVPYLNMMHEKLNGMLFGKGVWFSGRDGIPLYLSVKAGMFGKPLGNKEQVKEILVKQIQNSPEKRLAIIKLAEPNDEVIQGLTDEQKDKLFTKGLDIYLKTEVQLYDLLKYASISRLVFQNNSSAEEQEYVRRYLANKGINPSMIGVDTGTTGSVMISAMQLFGGIRTGNMIIWGGGKDINAPFSLIEDLPKKTDRTLYIDETQTPFRIMNPVNLQMLSWVCDHAIIRRYIPKVPSEKERVKKETRPISERLFLRYQDIALFCKDNKLNENDASKAIETYSRALEYISPVVIGFAHKLLSELGRKGPNSKLVFAGNDGLGAYSVAVKLLERFPNLYPDISSDQLKYIALTDDLVRNSSKETLLQYFVQENILDSDKVTIVDLGANGSINELLREKIPSLSWGIPESLISNTDSANGFIYDGKTKNSDVFASALDNPAVHFLKNTMSGEMLSATALVVENGWLFPNSLPHLSDKELPPEEIVKKRFALKALEDLVDTITDKAFTDLLGNQDKNIDRLNSFLSERSKYQHLLVTSK